MRDACGSNEVSRSSLGEVGPELNFLKNIHTYIHLFTYVTAWGLGEGNDTPLQYSCLENAMDGGA